MDRPLFQFYGLCDACGREFTDLTEFRPEPGLRPAYICEPCWRVLDACDADIIKLLRLIRGGRIHYTPTEMWTD